MLDPPPGEVVHWRLLTTHPVESVEPRTEGHRYMSTIHALSEATRAPVGQAGLPDLS